jgi:hypothetical protein
MNMIIMSNKDLLDKNEIQSAINISLKLLKEGNITKALKIMEHIKSMFQDNSRIFNTYGKCLESTDMISANHMYHYALFLNPLCQDIIDNVNITDIITKKIDFLQILKIDEKAPSSSENNEYLEIFHSTAIEGITFSEQEIKDYIENNTITFASVIASIGASRVFLNFWFSFFSKMLLISFCNLSVALMKSAFLILFSFSFLKS